MTYRRSVRTREFDPRAEGATPNSVQLEELTVRSEATNGDHGLRLKSRPVVVTHLGANAVPASWLAPPPHLMRRAVRRQPNGNRMSFGSPTQIRDSPPDR